MTDAAVAKIDRAVKSEMKRTILPGNLILVGLVQCNVFAVLN